jgi:hypothetical protein|tara:strand:+ start:171 stop:431 length:261 start_codon:yes stop_codon:yes gene_type:complete
LIAPAKENGVRLMTRCKLCHRDDFKGGYCSYHENAHITLIEAYDEWKRSIGIIWNGYLEEIIQAEETGRWAREVAKDLLTESSPEN